MRCVGPVEGDALVTIGQGIGGLPELGIEIDDSTSGRRLLRDALTLVPPGETVVAAVAPGNARALRSFLAAGFRPVASVQLIKCEPPPSTRNLFSLQFTSPSTRLIVASRVRASGWAT